MLLPEGGSSAIDGRFNKSTGFIIDHSLILICKDGYPLKLQVFRQMQYNRGKRNTSFAGIDSVSI